MQKELRLTRREDFNKVYRYGKSAANQQYVVYCLPNPRIERFRMGISVSKKLGGAVVRNRIRRVLKEIARLNEAKIRSHYDFVVIARKPVTEMEYKEMEKSLMHVLKRAQLLRNPS
ncbi:ribonuclease P protein component [Paenibacillus flagellatus]|uniref:Ribonuclease P protein component n=1 Tax=Paenibacillus flagellatus TaxID=2211139 RepID=A0A2V5K446_9BACL|nr:ribonuclease P protein component [Paenibacillus flagellatus]PYI52383.1 ribonuclease P protein component [Paenibacillus flagellatus]